MATQSLQQGATGKQVGLITQTSGGEYGEVLYTELQGRFYQMNYRGQIFSNGSSLTALSANTITLTATTTPIIGVWNPATSAVNLVILQAGLEVGVNNATSVAPGAFVWATSTGNAAISTGTAPFNRKTLLAAGSQAKGMSFIALTGLTNNLVVLEGADLAGQAALVTTAFAATNIALITAGVQNFDGSLIVPPGGVLALLNTVSSVTHSVAGRLMWAEVAV